MTQGKLLAIALREKSRAPMVELPSAEITLDAGVAGDFRGRGNTRQLTVLSKEGWQAACSDLNQDLAWTTRRANLLVEGLELAHTTGWLLHIGDVVLQVTGETKPCGRMDEQCAGLRDALTPQWRAGVCCRVVQAGRVEPGVDVRLERA